VLFHEIGHHVHGVARPEHREKEDVADVWKVLSSAIYNRQRFRWKDVVSRIIRPLSGAYLERLREKLELQMFKQSIWRGLERKRIPKFYVL